MSDTPRTDAVEKHAYEFKDEYTPVCESKFVRQLELELNEANERIKRLESYNNELCDTNVKLSQERDDLNVQLNAASDRIKRLEEAGDQLAKWVDRNTPATILNDWTAAKEAKL